jgi:hypothetical protein
LPKVRPRLVDGDLTNLDPAMRCERVKAHPEDKLGVMAMAAKMHA